MKPFMDFLSSSLSTSLMSKYLRNLIQKRFISKLRSLFSIIKAISCSLYRPTNNAIIDSYSKLFDSNIIAKLLTDDNIIWAIILSPASLWSC